MECRASLLHDGALIVHMNDEFHGDAERHTPGSANVELNLSASGVELFVAHERDAFDLNGGFGGHFSSPVDCGTFTVERHGERAIPRPARRECATSDTPSLSSILKGAADQHFPLALCPRGLSAGLCLMGEGHPVDPALALERRVAGDPVHEIDPHHHAARRGLSVSFHAPTMGQGGASVTLQPNGIAQ